MRLQPKNWAVFQHYKDRCPPWIKLHRDLLNNREFIRLPIASKALAPMMWLLASEAKDGIFDASVEELVFRLRITEKEYAEGVKPLIDNGFFIIASGVLADGYQGAIPETETETKGETDKNLGTNVPSPPKGERKKLPGCAHQKVLDLYHQHLPTLRRVEVWNDARQAMLRSRWREVAAEMAEEKEVDEEQVLTWWEEFFQHISRSKFLTGKVSGKDGRAFAADLEWIVRPTNFVKIVEGKYHGIS